MGLESLDAAKWEARARTTGLNSRRRHARARPGLVAGWISVLALGFLFAGCQTSATIYLRDGRIVRGPIEGRRADVLFVGDGQGGHRQKISANEIKRIDHPGGTEAIALGVVSTMLAGVAVAGGAMMGGTDAEDGSFGTGFMMVVIASPVALLTAIGAFWGLAVHNRSTNAAQPPLEIKKRDQDG